MNICLGRRRHCGRTSSSLSSSSLSHGWIARSTSTTLAAALVTAVASSSFWGRNYYPLVSAYAPRLTIHRHFHSSTVGTTTTIGKGNQLICGWIGFTRRPNQERQQQQQMMMTSLSKPIMSSESTSSSATGEGMAKQTLPALIDVDCNLMHVDLRSLKTNNYDPNVGTILSEDAVQESNIIAMLSPSSTLEESKQSIAFLQEYYKKHKYDDENEADDSHPTIPDLSHSLEIKTTVGVHPYHAQDEGLDFESFLMAQKDSNDTSSPCFIQSMIRTHYPSLVSAIGECGLDASEGFPSLQEYQIPWFTYQVRLAYELQVPLFVHERLAFHETMEILTKEEIKYMDKMKHKDDDTKKNIPIIIHCFTGTREECQQYMDKGYYISLSGYIARRPDDTNNVQEVRSCLEQGIIPLNRLMMETDAPYMGFDGCRQHWLTKQSNYVMTELNSKQRKKIQNGLYPNVPSSLSMVLDHIVECYNTGRTQRNEELYTRDYIASQCTLNAKSFFGFGRKNM